MSEFEVKDSGERHEFGGGMVRDTAEGKIDYTLIFDGIMYKRWAEHLNKGAEKYAPRNWMLGIEAQDLDVRERFKQSATRHFIQWLKGERDEDHAAAVFFNINGLETFDAEAAMSRGEVSEADLVREGWVSPDTLPEERQYPNYDPKVWEPGHPFKPSDELVEPSKAIGIGRGIVLIGTRDQIETLAEALDESILADPSRLDDLTCPWDDPSCSCLDNSP
jgi:hypothetical protein